MTSSSSAKILVCVLAVGACLIDLPASYGQQSYAWKFGNSRDGLITASIFSTNTLSRGSSRVIDYHPTLIIACRPGGDPQWSQSVQLKDPVSGNGTIDLAVRIDNGGQFSEQWVLGFQNRGFSKDGNTGVARLLRAKRLKVGWRSGFLSGKGEADFSLSGIKDALTKIAGTCGYGLP
jgi:hypothetical protein